MNELDVLIQRVAKTQHGFGDIKQAAQEAVAAHSKTDALALAKALYRSDVPQARMAAVFILGAHAAASPSAFKFMRQRVSKDTDWRVQEILAQAFDQCCKDTGYETVLPVIEEWLRDAHPNVRRAVSEGLRIWTARPYFKQHPDVAIRLLSQLRDDDSDTVRRSAGNALRDISRKHAELIRGELATWDLNDKRVAQVHTLASEFIR